ncbi:ribosomal RNA small subunit methyltransferase E [Patiriisocius marinistellae]|uniref:Ribosomal RNA small subunit methyltransferase E n=1 Tax=Patiriisocius marinistellae TaxID=2494560 RepID=A0A5J4G2C7_9FLAO|nr:16S rRNA (uracil(1498)-N(3))-methyltransferase [Patiriisocius marinistellae]GEQ86311.1 ribosomal RNA small subunit methyltransferase E [Patiriisocius marinistellae]
MQLFYNSTLTPSSSQIIFEKDESRHIIKVLRKQVGDILDLTDGYGNFYKATLESSNPKQCIAHIKGVEAQPKPEYNLHLAVAPTKLNDRYEWFLEKATEIGITQITPIICDHSERKVIKPERYEKIIQSAAKQSLKAYFPILNDAVSFKEFICTASEIETHRYIAHCEDAKKQSLKSVLKFQKDITILIGPEGDFSTSEIEFALKNNFDAIHLGKNRLRTETAAIVACHSVSYHFV